jgi:hypothetical protein
MAYEQRDNSGSIFVNDRKEKDTHPDRTGTAMIDGAMYYVSGWLKQGSKGQFLSLAFKRKEEQQPREQRTVPATHRAVQKRNDPISTGRFDDDGEIPF